jgi:hypothetical protein
MKMLFEKCVIALDEYAKDSRSVVKWATQEQSIKSIKLDFANELKKQLQQFSQDKDGKVTETDYDELLHNIEKIQKELTEKREGRKVEPGYFDALLVWIADRLNAAKQQLSPAAENENIINRQLSETQQLIKNKFDEYIVLLGGFPDFPDSRNTFEMISKYHPKVALYPIQEGWNEKALSSKEEIGSVVEQLETLKQATIH